MKRIRNNMLNEEVIESSRFRRLKESREQTENKKSKKSLVLGSTGASVIALMASVSIIVFILGGKNEK